MSAPKRKTARSSLLRRLAQARTPTTLPADLENVTPDEIRRIIHELEVHQVELQIQNDQLEQTQRDAEEARDRYRELYESTPVGLLTLDPSGKIVETNAFLSILLDTPKPRLVGRKLSAFVAPHHQDRWHREKHLVLEGGQRGTAFDLALVSAEGRPMLVQLVGLAVGGHGAAQREARFAIIDVTTLRSTERSLRAAAVAAAQAEEGERRKLASDLHDDAGQLLSLAGLKLAGAIDAAGPELAGAIREAADLVADARRRISSLSFQLSPPLLHDLGLFQAVQWLAEDLGRRYGLRVAVTDQGELPLDEAVRVTFFRVIRELLINVAKHAGVADARVRLWSEGRVAFIAVEDAGVGLPPEKARHGFGLLAFRERLEQLGGTLETRSTPGGGTTVVATLPPTDQQRD